MAEQDPFASSQEDDDVEVSPAESQVISEVRKWGKGWHRKASAFEKQLAEALKRAEEREAVFVKLAAQSKGITDENMAIIRTLKPNITVEELEGIAAAFVPKKPDDQATEPGKDEGGTRAPEAGKQAAAGTGPSGPALGGGDQGLPPKKLSREEYRALVLRDPAEARRRVDAGEVDFPVGVNPGFGGTADQSTQMALLRP